LARNPELFFPKIFLVKGIYLHYKMFEELMLANNTDTVVSDSAN